MAEYVLMAILSLLNLIAWLSLEPEAWAALHSAYRWDRIKGAQEGDA